MYYIQLYHRRGKSGAERERPMTKLSVVSWGLQREGKSGCRKNQLKSRELTLWRLQSENE